MASTAADGRRFRWLVFALALAAAAAVHAQTSPQNSVPPDQQAFRAAWAQSDPRDQIDALEKVAVDFPDTRSASSARMAALRLLVKLFPDAS